MRFPNPLRGYFQQRDIQRLILLWEDKIKPDLLNEALQLKEPDAVIAKAFLEIVERRMVAHIVMSVAGDVDKKRKNIVRQI